MTISARVTQHAVKTELNQWHDVASRFGIDSHYVDGLGRKCVAPLDTVRAAMSAMGAPVAYPKQAARWIAQFEKRPPGIQIAWDGKSAEQHFPFGCHRIEGRSSWVLSAPSRHVATRAPRVGAFLPLYALHSERSLGVADLSDLKSLAVTCQKHGRDFVATLPLFATFLDKQGAHAARYDPSPYAPVSRSFFNELYLDVRATPEWPNCGAAHQALAQCRKALDDELSATYVDFAKLTELRRPIIEALMRHSGPLDVSEETRAYASFRSQGNARHDQYHRYVQVRLQQQLEVLSEEASLYLDLPVGVHRGGFDAERFASDFLDGFSAGAPPDAMFRSGQCWGISALDPLGAQDSAYASFRSAVDALSRYSRLLRLDHVMALHRTFCVPDGASASEGVYIRANSDELYAALLSTAASVPRPPVLIGEDLGTVPDTVRETLRRRGVLGMHVMQLDPSAKVSKGTCASINTHDLATFAAYERGDDLQDFLALGFLDEAELEKSMSARQLALAGQTYEDLRARALQSDAAHVLLSLEDEWAELSPQNTPGTSTQRHNFKRRSKLSLKKIAQHLAEDK